MNTYKIGERVRVITDFAEYVIEREIFRENNDHPMSIYIARQLGSSVNDLLICNDGPFIKDLPYNIFAYGDGRCNKELVEEVRKHVDDKTLISMVAENDTELADFISSCLKMADCQ
jgi:hypothetical protein